MKVNQFLYQHAAWWFIGFFILVLWAFWPSYFSKLHQQPDIRNHTHGVAMSLWCLMLITQAYLIRRKRFQLHRVIGKWSYVLMTFLIILTFNLIHSRLQKEGPLGTMDLVSLALMVNGTLALMAIYGLAIYHRKRPLIHARYMICTVFPLFTPLTDRLIYGHFRPLIQYVPTIEGNPIVPIVGFLMADLLVLGLILWDWKNDKRLDVFPKVLIILLIYHISLFTFYKFGFWNDFGVWFLGLPLS